MSGYQICQISLIKLSSVILQLPPIKSSSHLQQNGGMSGMDFQKMMLEPTSRLILRMEARCSSWTRWLKQSSEEPIRRAKSRMGVSLKPSIEKPLANQKCRSLSLRAKPDIIGGPHPAGLRPTKS